MPLLDQTHDPSLRSWIDSANAPDGDFPIQNLPFGVFCAAGAAATVGVAIGDRILDVAAVSDRLSPRARAAAESCAADSLNGLMAMGRPAARALRQELSRLLSEPSGRPHVQPHLHGMADVELQAPVRVGDYTDFYASIDHATHVGRLFRPDHPLLANYRWVPIAYHGRASTIVPSGRPVRRPWGQALPPGAAEPVFRPAASLDYELELGVYLGAAAEPGRRLTIEQAGDQIFGFSLLNDWSARDIQAWEYQPLGPFLSKNFATSVGAWVVTADAMEPFRRTAAPRGDAPPPLPYLASARDQAEGGLGIDMQALILTDAMRRDGRQPAPLSRADFGGMYWTVAQMLAHHASNGCRLQVGDLLGSGTVSGPDPRSGGCLLEITSRGAEPVTLPGGETRGFLDDGDEIVLRARCEREGFAPIGFGECRAQVLAAD